MARTDAEFAQACWEAGARPSWASERADGHAAKCYLTYSPNACGWAIDCCEWPYGEEEQFEASEFHDHLDGHMAACLFRCKMLDDIAQQPKTSLTVGQVVGILSDRDALLEAWRGGAGEMTDTDLHTRLAELCEKVGIEAHRYRCARGFELCNFVSDREEDHQDCPDDCPESSYRAASPAELLARAEAWVDGDFDRRSNWVDSIQRVLGINPFTTPRQIIYRAVTMAQYQRVKAIIKVLEREVEDA